MGYQEGGKEAGKKSPNMNDYGSRIEDQRSISEGLEIKKRRMRV